MTELLLSIPLNCSISSNNDYTLIRFRSYTQAVEFQHSPLCKFPSHLISDNDQNVVIVSLTESGLASGLIHYFM